MVDVFMILVELASQGKKIKSAVDFLKLVVYDVFLILDELAIDVREVEEEEKRSGGQGQASSIEETF